MANSNSSSALVMGLGILIIIILIISYVQFHSIPLSFEKSIREISVNLGSPKGRAD